MTGLKWMKLREDLKGQRFGSLVLTGNYQPQTRQSGSKVECICDCGSVSFKILRLLKNTQTGTCSGRCPFSSHWKHCHTGSIDGKQVLTKEYIAWRNMKRGCTQESCKNYKYIGALGITYCDAFKEFLPFLDLIGFSPSKYHQLNRIDREKNFEPGNLEWRIRERKKKIA